MNNKLLNVVMLAVGAAIGSAVTWKLVKDKYEQIANDDIASVREEYKDLLSNMKKKLQESVEYEEPETEETREDRSKDDDKDTIKEEKERVEYHQMASRYRGSEDDEEGGKWDQNEEEVQRINGPYVITPEEFSSSPPGYNVQPLDYFADGILADDWGMTLDIEETIGEESLDHIGEYVDDIVYVRNERTEIDYEVTKDPRTYKDALQTNPDPYYGKYET